MSEDPKSRKLRAEYRKRNKLCQTCGEAVCEESNRFCVEHLAKYNTYQKNYQKTHKRTAGSIAQANKRRKIHRRNNAAAGLCVHCGRPVTPGSKSLCETHLKTAGYGSAVYLHRRHTEMTKRAKSHGLEIMSAEEFIGWWRQTPEVCHYCGILAVSIAKRSCKTTLQVDRINNDLGYSIANICKACWRCNHLKSNFFTYEQWLEIAKRFIKPRLKEFQGLDR